MKPLLRLVLLIAFAFCLVPGRALFGLPGAPAQANSVTSGAQLPSPAMPIPPELRNQADLKFPVKGSPLPLVSLIGFGLLIGGIIPAMRAHKAIGTHL